MHLASGRLMRVKGCNRSYLISESNRRVVPSCQGRVRLREPQVERERVETKAMTVNHPLRRRGKQKPNHRRVEGVWGKVDEKN